MKQIININSSALPSLNCFRRFWNKFVLNKRNDGCNYNDTEWGSAWHIFRQTLAQTQQETQAISLASTYFSKKMASGMLIRKGKDHLNVDYLMAVCLRYISTYGKEKSWGKYEILKSPVDNVTPLVEQTFSIKILESDYCIINLQGTIDELVLHPVGYLVIGDDKTSSKWDIKGHLKSYELRPQLRFYRLALQLLSEQEGGDWYKELLTRRVGARINGVYLKPEVSKVVFEQSDVYFFSDEELNMLRNQLMDLACKINNRLKFDSDNLDENNNQGFIPPPDGILNSTCASCYCEYQNMCNKPEAVYRSMLNNMKTTEYNPLEFRKLD